LAIFRGWFIMSGFCEYLTCFVRFGRVKMGPRWVQVLLVLLSEHWSAHRSVQIRFLQLQIELLRDKLPGNRVILSPEERMRLLRAGAAMNHHVHDVIGIVSVKTYQQWLREQAAGRQPGRVGRPRKITESLRELILRLAKENVGWGVRRVVGELQKLAITRSRSSVRRVLVDEGMLPDPGRHAPKGVVTPWRSFVAAHMNSMVACDFFCKKVWTPMGVKLAFVLIFVHLSSRKVFATPGTFHSTGLWMQQQARNIQMWAQDNDINVQFLIHDWDAKFTEAFDDAFKQTEPNHGGVVKTPFLAPIANCYAESWIGSFKRECLNHLFCFSLGQLDHITQTYVRYHNTLRPHQGLGNIPIPVHIQSQTGTPPPPPEAPPDAVPPPAEPVTIGQIQRQQWLGGLLRHYHRKAA
ncbi:MAG: transposase, partial [Rhodospirillales bacterium]|nr:transposase [Rhodospirillales bacterium]